MRSTAPDQFPPGTNRLPNLLNKVAAYTPFAVVFYFALQLALRLYLSPNLEVDDAEMVGQIGWAWGYPNSHPPLFHWLVRLCYDAFGSWPAATAVPKYALLCATYLLIYDGARRAARSNWSGAIAIAALFFIPVVAWKTQGKLTHSILGCAATAATMHAFVLILTRGGWWTFLWLGTATAIGLLAKYNFVLVVAASVVALLAVPEMRRKFLRPAAWLAPAAIIVLITPHLIWLGHNSGRAAERLYMLRTGGGPLGMNLGANSVRDGFVSLIFVILVSIVPAILMFALASLFSREAEAIPTSHSRDISLPKTVRKFAGFLLVAELGWLAVVMACAGIFQVHERYLLVLLPPLALWLACGFPVHARPRGAAFLLAAVVLLALFITSARVFSIIYGDGRLAWPYAEMTEEIKPLLPEAVAILGDRPENAANLAIRLPGVSIFNPEAKPERVLLVADTESALSQVAARLGNGYAPVSERRMITHSQRWSERKATLATQLWQRRP